MWYALYRLADDPAQRTLYSQGHTPARAPAVDDGPDDVRPATEAETAAWLAEKGLAQKCWDMDRPRDLWNPVTLEYDTPRPEPRAEVIPASAFLGGLSRDQRKALREARKSDGIVDDFMDIMQISGEVDPNIKDVAEALAHMKAKGLV